MKERLDAAMEKLEGLLELGGTKKDIWLLAISAVALAASIVVPASARAALPCDPAWVAILLCGIPIICEAIIGLVTEFDITADVLVALALIASVAIGETFAAGEVAFIMQLGGLLEELTVARARAGIEKLVHLTPRTARRISDGQEETVPAEAVRIGDILRVIPGETIPVDGIIVAGQTSINQAVMTGESIPVDKSVGDEVSSGTLNQFGSFDMRATKVGEDSSIQRMIRLVQSADAGKAKIVNLADRWAVWIVVIALVASAVTWAISGQIIRAVTILVVFCPCALVLATPTAIMAAIGNATKHGILVREGDALERLAQVGRIAFDKTGTLTHGTPCVVAAEGAGTLQADDLLALAAQAEQKSEHPLGRAIVNGWRESARSDGELSSPLPEPPAFTMMPGRGVKAVCQADNDNPTVYAGNRELIAEAGIALPAGLLKAAQRYLDEGCTVIYVAICAQDCESSLGIIALSDTPRESAPATVEGIRAAGVEPVLLTGDNPSAARTVARSTGISEYRAECKPEDKLDWICESEKAGVPVCMVGDGVNDAPALKRARVGIAMGGIGSDIAVDAADIALVSDDISQLPHLIRLSKRMMTTIKLNMTFSMTLNFVAITLAILGVLDPVVGALVHNAGSVLVITNSALLLGWKQR